MTAGQFQGVAEITEAEKARRSFRIAVADDEATMRDDLNDVLTRLGHEVVFAAATGRELIDATRELEPAIAMAMRRFAQFQAPVKDAADLRQALEDRKVIERAKGVLMRQADLDEQSAFRRLQKLASEKNLELVSSSRSRR